METTLSTTPSQVSTLQSEVITGGSYSDNTLSLTKQGGGSVDIPFDEHIYSLCAGVRFFPTDFTLQTEYYGDTHAASSYYNTTSYNNSSLRSLNQNYSYFFDATGGYEYRSGRDGTYYPVIFDAQAKSKILNTLQQQIPVCTTPRYTLNLHMGNSTQSIMDHDISVEITSISDNKITDISLGDSYAYSYFQNSEIEITWIYVASCSYTG